MVRQGCQLSADYEAQSRPLLVVRGPLWVHFVHRLEHGAQGKNPEFRSYIISDFGFKNSQSLCSLGLGRRFSVSPHPRVVLLSACCQLYLSMPHALPRTTDKKKPLV